MCFYVSVNVCVCVFSIRVCVYLCTFFTLIKQFFQIKLLSFLAKNFIIFFSFLKNFLTLIVNSELDLFDDIAANFSEDCSTS